MEGLLPPTRPFRSERTAVLGELAQECSKTSGSVWYHVAVVGLLLAALYQPVWTSAVSGPKDFGLALVALVALVFWKLPPWLFVVGSRAAGWLILQ